MNYFLRRRAGTKYPIVLSLLSLGLAIGALMVFFTSAAVAGGSDRLSGEEGMCIRQSHLDEHYLSDYIETSYHVRVWQPRPRYLPTIGGRVRARVDRLDRLITQVDNALGDAEERYGIYRRTLREWYETEGQRRRLGGATNPDSASLRRGHRHGPRPNDIDVIINVDFDLHGHGAPVAVVLPTCSERKAVMVINAYSLNTVQVGFESDSALAEEELGYLLAHEMSHIFQKRLEGDDDLQPSWLREATAVYAGNQIVPDTSNVLALDRALLDNDMYLLPLDHHIVAREFYENPLASVVQGRGYSIWRMFQWYRLEYGPEASHRLLAEIFDRYSVGNGLRATTRLRDTFRTVGQSLSDALGKFWRDHLVPRRPRSENGRSVLGERRTFELSLGRDERWEFSADRVAPKIGRMHIYPDSDVQFVRVSSPPAGDMDLKLWIFDRNEYFDWSDGGSVTYQVADSPSALTCPSEDGTIPAFPRLPSEIAFAYVNGRISSGNRAGRIDIHPIGPDETPECPSPSERHSVGNLPSRTTSTQVTSSVPTVTDGVTTLPPGTTTLVTTGVTSTRDTTTRATTRETTTGETTDVSTRETTDVGSTRETSTSRPPRRTDTTRPPRRTDTTRPPRRTDDDHGHRVIDDCTRDRLRHLIERLVEWRDRSGYPGWVWLLVAGGAAGFGAQLAADVFADVVALPAAGLMAAESLQSWLASRGFAVGEGGVLIDGLGRPVGPAGAPLRFETVAAPPGPDGVVDAPGGVSARAHIVDGAGHEVARLPMDRGGTPTGVSYGVQGAGSSESGLNELVRYVDGRPVGGVSFEEAGLRLMHDGAMYFEDRDGVWRNARGLTLLDEILETLPDKAADKVIDSLNNRQIEHLLELEVAPAATHACVCQTAPRSMIAKVVDPTANPLVSGRNFVRFFGSGLPGEGDGPPVDPVPDPVPDPTPSTTPAPGTPPPSESEDGSSYWDSFVGAPGEFMFTGWDLQGGNVRSNNNCYRIRRSSREGPFFQRLDGDAYIRTPNGSSWRLQADINMELRTWPSHDPLSEGEQTVIKGRMHYDGVFSQRDPELRLHAKQISGQFCIVRPERPPSCKPLNNPRDNADTPADARDHNIQIGELTPRRFHIRITNPTLPRPLRINLPKHPAPE